MKSKKLEHSARSLTQLYTVVIGVALSMAVRTAVNPDIGIADINMSVVSLFVAFVATIVPFYHGALRHIDDAYIDKNIKHIKTSALIFDFILLFFHGIAFVVLALLVNKPQQFFWILVGVLLIDVAWGVFVWAVSAKGNSIGAEGKWAIINFVFVLLAIAYLSHYNISIADVSSPKSTPAAIVCFCLLRTVLDYVLCRKFYFPE